MIIRINSSGNAGTQVAGESSDPGRMVNVAPAASFIDEEQLWRD